VLYIGKKEMSQISLTATTLSLENSMGKKVKGGAETFSTKEMFVTYFECFD